MTVVPYFTLAPDILKDIVALKMGKLVKRLSETHKMKLVYSKKVVDQIAARCTEPPPFSPIYLGILKAPLETKEATACSFVVASTT